jgi:hypothetical protein
MSAICFLLDEHVPLIIQAELVRMEPEMRVYAVGDDPAPLKGTPDPDILGWIEDHGCMLIINNRATMPVHLQQHLARGRHVPGVVQLPRLLNIATILGDLVLLWGGRSPNEFQDRIVYLPLRR